MKTINNLSSIDKLSLGDLIAVWNTANGDTRKASINTLINYISSNIDIDTLILNSLDDLPAADQDDICFVKDIDRGGIFVYDASLSRVTDANNGTIINPYGVSTGYGCWVRQYEGDINVKWFGATNNDFDVVTTTEAFQAAFNTGENIYIPSEVFYINDTINVTSNMTITANGSKIDWDGLNTSPLFKITAPADNISFKGGVFTGEPSAWLESIGVTPDPTSITDYARYSVEDVKVSGALIFINAQKAARFKVSRVQTYTANGILGVGKIVEVKISDSVIFGSTGAVGTYGIQASVHPDSVSGSYPEGYHISNCTIDNFDRTLYITEIFVFTIVNCYLAKTLNGTVPIYFKRGNTSTHCREITINCCTISGGIHFGATSGGTNYHAKIIGNTFISCDGSSIQLDGNTYTVQIINNEFETPTGTGNNFAVLASDNVGDIDIHGNKVADGYTRIFQCSGSNGDQINVCNNYGDLTQSTYVSRPVNIRNTGTDTDNQYVNITGSPTIGVDFTGTITANFAKGQRAFITISLNYTSTNAGLLKVILPSGLTTAEGSGWSVIYINVLVSATTKNITLNLPVYASTDIASGVISLQNEDIGGTISASYHSGLTLTRI